ncbi:unnamed protein product [Caenorhabditis sp. 36 PRJEB53466]|nr:unnamed protein product [Caenorhabditis sp. 36 PRJEB53466]
MAECVPYSGYLFTSDFIVLSLHLMTCLEVPMLSLGAYVILYKTPAQMRYVKWLMLNLHFWESLADITVSFFYLPYVYFPALAGFNLGIIDAPGFWVFLFVTLLAAMGASVLALYENRYFILFGQNNWWSRWRFPCLFFIYSTVPLFFLIPYFKLPEQESARRAVYEQLPCIPKLTFEGRQLFVLSLDLTVTFASLASETALLVIPLYVFFILTLYNIFTGKLKSASQRTMNMQKKFAIALTLQSAYLMIVILAPICMTFYSLFTLYHNQAYNNFICLMFSFHGFGSTFVMIFVHAPYRQFVLSLFYYIVPKSPLNVTVVRNTI